jgi:hypothetical protein
LIVVMVVPLIVESFVWKSLFELVVLVVRLPVLVMSLFVIELFEIIMRLFLLKKLLFV